MVTPLVAGLGPTELIIIVFVLLLPLLAIGGAVWLVVYLVRRRSS